MQGPNDEFMNKMVHVSFLEIGIQISPNRLERGRLTHTIPLEIGV